MQLRELGPGNWNGDLLRSRTRSIHGALRLLTEALGTCHWESSGRLVRHLKSSGIASIKSAVVMRIALALQFR